MNRVCYNATMSLRYFLMRFPIVNMTSLGCAGILLSVSILSAGAVYAVSGGQDGSYREYIDFFEEVYRTMDENYFQPVQRKDFKRFLKTFDKKIYPQLKGEGKRSEYITWRSAAYLVDFMKDPRDDFSAFLPPQVADDFQRKVLGEKIDLGIEGRLTAEGFRVGHVEPRSDAYRKGLRPEALVKAVNGQDIGGLTESEIQELLTPLKGTETMVRYIDPEDGRVKTLELVSQQYYKQTVFMVPTPVEDVYCLEITRFNRKTSDDLFRYLELIGRKDHAGLILDLRGNPGGPPLAAWEISSFFLEPNQEFAYFKKRDQPKSSLVVPEIPERFRYEGPVVILVNEKSGSASELFSGVLQRRGRAILMGVSTAGRVLLKSMFHFEDGSMVALVTARGYFPDGSVFPFEGVRPDKRRKEEGDRLIAYAARYIKSHTKKVP